MIIKASEDITDTYGHCIVAGESYLEVMYLQQVASKIGKRVKYSKPKKECAFIHIAEVSVTNIDLHNF